MVASDDGRFEFERYRAYLLLLARWQRHKGADGALDSSDAVQQTLLQAYRKREQFRGQTQAEMAAWLRQILAHVIADGCKKRLPRVILDDLDQSTARLENLLQTAQTTPSEKLQRKEQLLQLAGAMESLLDDERAAVELTYFHGCSRAEIARQLNRPTAKAAGDLVARAMRKLRLRMREHP